MIENPENFKTAKENGNATALVRATVNDGDSRDSQIDITDAAVNVYALSCTKRVMRTANAANYFYSIPPFCIKSHAKHRDGRICDAGEHSGNLHSNHHL